jgi:peptidyl-prolyl cis-trans isomerase A (cyclophilin A)
MRTLLALPLLALMACGSPTPETKPAPPAEKPAQPVEKPAPPPPAPAAAAPVTPPAGANPALYDPSKASLTAPETYAVKFETTAGEFILDVTRAWSPLGADRLYNLVKAGFYDDTGFFRVVPGFVVQFGLNGDPAVNKVWRDARIQDDPASQTNARGTVVFATSGPNTRTTQVFINFADNPRLDKMGFTPFGKVRDMATVDKINPAHGQKPNQGEITMNGNAYLKTAFPDLSFITKATIVE